MCIYWKFCVIIIVQVILKKTTYKLWKICTSPIVFRKQDQNLAIHKNSYSDLCRDNESASQKIAS